jgi:hypothetical protein
MRRGRALAGGCLITAMLSGCTASLRIGGPPSAAPRCLERPADKPERLNGPLVLTAQSVPSARLIPCVRPLPAGWTFRKMEAREGRTEIALDFGRTNDNATTVTLTKSCEVRNAKPTRSDQANARRFDRVDASDSGFRGDRYYVFSGGCVAYHFDVAGRAATQSVATIARSLSFVDRSVLRRYVHRYSGGRVELDP